MAVGGVGCAPLCASSFFGVVVRWLLMRHLTAIISLEAHLAVLLRDSLARPRRVKIFARWLSGV